MDRNFGTLGKLIRSHSRPHASLEESITRQSKAEIISSLGRQYLPQEWAEGTGHGPKPSELPRRSLKPHEAIRPDCVLIPPRSASAYLDGAK